MPASDSREINAAGTELTETPAAPRLPFDTILVLACAVVPYLASLRFDFAYDDDTQVLENPGITSWRHVLAYFTQPIAGFFHGVTSAHYYRPIFFLWLRLNYFTWGPHPTGWHLTNIALHAAASCLVFAVLRRYFPDRRWAALGAMLFAVHPAHVETVAWVSGCTDSLMAVSLFGSLLLWMKNREGNSPRYFVGSLACCALALLTKETAIVLPALILGHAYLKLPADHREHGKAFIGALRTSAPYALVAAIYIIVRHVILQGLPQLPAWVSLPHALLTTPLLLLFYIGHLIWPVNLGLYYDAPMVRSAASLRFLIPVAILAALLVAGFFLIRRTRDVRLALAGLWFFLPLAPVLYIGVFQPDDFVHDRYLYVPALAVSILFGCLCEFLSKSPSRAPRVLWAIRASAALILALAIATFIEARPWQNNLTLYANAVRISPNHPLARNNLAREYAQIERFNDAAILFEGLLEDHPDLWLANYNYGFVNYRLGRLPLAEEYLGKAIHIDPKEADQHLYLGATYLKENRLAAAEAQLKTALALDPQGRAYHFTLAVVYMQQGRLPAARDEMELELKYHPENAAIRGQLDAVNRALAAPR